MTQISLATAYNSDFAALGEMSAATLRFYAASQSCSVHIETSIPSTGRPASWYKVQLLQRLLAEGHEWVFWIDADALFLRFDFDVRRLIESDKHLYLVAHKFSEENDSPAVPNCGVLLIRNCEWSHRLLNSLWNSERYANHKWWENAALIHLLGFQQLLGEGENRPNSEMLEHVAFIGTEWNSIPESCSSPKPIIHHYAGMAFEQRLSGMCSDFVISLQAAEGAGVLSEEWQRALDDHRKWLLTTLPGGARTGMDPPGPTRSVLIPGRP